MITVCAASVMDAADAFETLGEVRVVADGAINADVVRDADALVTRSKTAIDEQLVAGSSLRFVGTATAGFDHIDAEAMAKHHIAWTAAAGCNAVSVAEYVVAALLRKAVDRGLHLSDMTLGVVGCGQVGGRVVTRARALGMRVLENDPPLQEKTGDDRFVDLECIARESDVVTFHVPWTKDGLYATEHMVDREFLGRCRPGLFFINASRGEVVNESALRAALQSGAISSCVLDVWEREPCFGGELFSLLDFGTPHIAGYSADGKLRGTEIIYEAVCDFFGLEKSWIPRELPAPPEPLIALSDATVGFEEQLDELVRRVYGLDADHQRMAAVAGGSDAERSASFKAQRKNYPLRREFASVRLDASSCSKEVAVAAAGLGFVVDL